MAAGELGDHGNANGRINHITLVSAITEANVPSNTAIDAGSIQVPFWRAITNTFSAGGSDAINTDHPEMRQRQIEDVDHASASSSSFMAPIGTLDGPATAKVNSLFCL